MNHKRAALFTIPFAIGIALAVPGIAAAHNALANGTCQNGIGWEVTNYDKTQTNSIVVRDNGVIVYQDLDFKASDAGGYATDRTISHTWTVTVDAPGTQWDRNLSGSYAACETAPTTTVTDVTTTTVVAVGEPPVPTTPDDTVTPDCRDTNTCELPQTPTTLQLIDVVDITPSEPALPRTGVDGTFFLFELAGGLVGIGVLLLWARRRVG